MKNKKFLAKSLSGVLCASMIMANIIPTFAATTETQTTSNEVDSKETEVLYEESGTYFVTIPKTIILDADTLCSDYSIKVEGDIPSDKQVYVSPIDGISEKEGFNFYMKDQSEKNPKADVVANVTQNKFYWNYEDTRNAYVESSNSVSAPNISAGSWRGAFDFEINLHNVENEMNLTLSTDGDVLMGIGEAKQVNAYIDGEIANTDVTWISDNSNITVTEGLIETKASAQVGDTATITVIAKKAEELTTAENILSDLGIITLVHADDTLTASFDVTVIDMSYTATGEDTVITSLDIKPGESKDVEVTIIPASVSGNVSWSTTAPAGLNMVINGNTVTLKAADDMVAGNTYDLVATYGTFSKLLKVNIVSGVHTHNYIETITKNATCIENGEKTYTCDCGDSYTDKIPATGHSFENDTCTKCGEEKVYEAGLYNENNVMIVPWDELVNDYGMNIEKNYTYNDSRTNPSSPYYIFTKNNLKGKLVVDNNVTKIGSYTFSGCTNLYGITLGKNVTSIGSYTFSECTNLIDVKMYDNVNIIDYSAFMNCTNLASINFSQSLESIGSQGFYGCSSLTKVEIPDSLIEIKDYAFKKCTNLTHVEMGDNVASIGYHAFSGCAKLVSVKIPDNVKDIIDGTFYGCTNLTSVTLPSNLKTIASSAFRDCANLTNIIIPNKVTSIGVSAFYNCTSLSEVIIPSGVTSIGSNAFYKVPHITYNGTATGTPWGALSIN